MPLPKIPATSQVLVEKTDPSCDEIFEFMCNLEELGEYYLIVIECSHNLSEFKRLRYFLQGVNIKYQTEDAESIHRKLSFLPANRSVDLKGWVPPLSGFAINTNCN